MSLNTRKKRKKNLQDEDIVQDALIFRLPHETLIHIFKFLSTEELILASGLVKQNIFFFKHHFFFS